MRDTTAFPSGQPQNNTMALRDDLRALYSEMGVLEEVLGLRMLDAEIHLRLIPLIRNLHERLKRLEAIPAK